PPEAWPPTCSRRWPTRGSTSRSSRRRRSASLASSAPATWTAPCALSTRSSGSSRRIASMPDARVGVVGATGAVGEVTRRLLRERGYENVRLFASARSAGRTLDGVVVEEATPAALAAGELDLVLFSVGTSASRELVPHAVRGGATVVDKSSAYRLEPGIPLVVPEVNGDRGADPDGILANPNCCPIPLTCVLKPLHAPAGLRRVRVSTSQAV